MSGPTKVKAQSVDFNKVPGYSNPFGNYSYDGSKFNSTLSPEMQNSYNINSKGWNDVSSGIPSNGAQQNDFTKNWQQTYYDRMLQQSLPDYIGNSYSRGVGAGSSGFQTGLGNLYLNAGQQSVLGAQDLANQQFGQMLQAGNYFGGNLNQIYNQMAGTAGIGNAGGNQYLGNEQQNANRLLSGQEFNAQMSQKQNEDLMQMLTGGSYSQGGGQGGYGGGYNPYGGGSGYGNSGYSIDPQTMQMLMWMQQYGGGMNSAAAVGMV